MYGKTTNRRAFIHDACIALSFPLVFGCGRDTSAQPNRDDILAKIKKNARTSGADLSWSGAKDARADVSWRTVISNETEGVVPILISGTVYQADKRSPAENVLIYLYHTDAAGYYGRNGEHRHGRYRGWMLTGKDGRYEFRSIKPASYPDSAVASHIHMTVTTESLQEDWIDSILFEGDRFITPQERAVRKGGFNPILSLTKGADGIYRGSRDIQLW